MTLRDRFFDWLTRVTDGPHVTAAMADAEPPPIKMAPAARAKEETIMGNEAIAEIRCNEQHPGVEKMKPCWYPKGHPTPHSWETLRPLETFESREAAAFGRWRL